MYTWGGYAQVVDFKKFVVHEGLFHESDAELRCVAVVGVAVVGA